MAITTISPPELAVRLKRGAASDLIDVRTPVEYREVHVDIARNVPLDQLDPAALMEGRNGSTNEPLYLICRSGSRGQQACEKFLKAGFTNVANVEGGTDLCWNHRYLCDGDDVSTDAVEPGSGSVTHRN